MIHSSKPYQLLEDVLLVMIFSWHFVCPIFEQSLYLFQLLNDYPRSNENSKNHTKDTYTHFGTSKDNEKLDNYNHYKITTNLFSPSH